jgi:hypothetical protein
VESSHRGLQRRVASSRPFRSVKQIGDNRASWVECGGGNPAALGPSTFWARGTKANINIYVSSTTQRWPNKIIKIFLFEDFFHLPPVLLTPVANLELRISPRIFEKIWNYLNGILWGQGETDSWKEPEAKISWHCPFNTNTVQTSYPVLHTFIKGYRYKVPNKKVPR